MGGVKKGDLLKKKFFEKARKKKHGILSNRGRGVHFSCWPSNKFTILTEIHWITCQIFKYTEEKEDNQMKNPIKRKERNRHLAKNLTYAAWSH